MGADREKVWVQPHTIWRHPSENDEEVIEAQFIVRSAKGIRALLDFYFSEMRPPHLTEFKVQWWRTQAASSLDDPDYGGSGTVDLTTPGFPVRELSVWSMGALPIDTAPLRRLPIGQVAVALRRLASKDPNEPESADLLAELHSMPAMHALRGSVPLLGQRPPLAPSRGRPRRSPELLRRVAELYLEECERGQRKGFRVPLHQRIATRLDAELPRLPTKREPIRRWNGESVRAVVRAARDEEWLTDDAQPGRSGARPGPLLRQARGEVGQRSTEPEGDK